MLEIANVADLAERSRSLYREHPELGDLHGPISKGLELCKYLRNKYVGHFVPELTDKTYEWLPHINALIGSREPDKPVELSWFTLETAITTYVDETSGHKIFESETDLNYAPGQTLFLDFLGETVLGAIAFVSRLIEITRDYVNVPDMKKDWVELAIKVGETDFGYLTKDKR
ncbi:MAG: hypothetical protein COW16_12270 [Sphingomonadales bacterium CG12_big_fil_rev_8_21_14_0_65_65_10]|nr:MAG: hypothetical protein COW16_12270 [Sphingomonadales bacterium CG12_big_fil_rev_8_21_14_0_65_65_10]